MVERPPARMTSSGKRWAALIAIVIAAALPKTVLCGYPGADRCDILNAQGRVCEWNETEPIGFFVVELVLSRDVGFAYSTSQNCR